MQSFWADLGRRLGAAAGRRGRPGVAAAVCCRRRDGEVEFALVSTRDGERWTFPKGHREPGETLAVAAAREAREEAGVLGTVDDRCLLTYRYPGRLGRDVLVAAFILDVTEVGTADDAFRTLAWCDYDGARRRLAERRDPFHARELHRVLAAAERRVRVRVRVRAGPHPPLGRP